MNRFLILVHIIDPRIIKHLKSTSMGNDELPVRITPRDVAKFIGCEKEYDDALLELQLKHAHDTIMGEEFEIIDLSGEKEIIEDSNNQQTANPNL